MKKCIYILLTIEFIILDIFCFIEIISGQAYKNEGWFLLIGVLFTAILLFTIPKLWIEGILDYEPSMSIYATISEIILYVTPLVLFVLILIDYKKIMIYDIKCVLFIFSLALAPILELIRHKIENNYEPKTKEIKEDKIDKLRREYKEREEIIRFFENHAKEKETKINKENIFYNEQLKKCTPCEKEYYNLLYELYSDKYYIETQIYLRSMYPKMGAPNNRIDIVFFEKPNYSPILLVEIQDSTHKSHARAQSDKGLKEFCESNNIKLQRIYTTFGCNKKSIKNLIDKKLAE